MSNIFNHTAHVLLWDWLSKNPTKNKEDWDGWKINGGKYDPILHDCFACYYKQSFSTCKYCPLESQGIKYSCLGGLWDDYCFLQAEDGYVYDVDKRSELAERIRDLPVREGVEVI